VLHSFYVQLLLIKLVSSLNWELWSKSDFQSRLAWTRPYMSWIWPK